MRVIFDGNLGGKNPHLYDHVSILPYYGEQAFINASIAKQATDNDPKHHESTLAVLFSSFWLEAFLNEEGEKLLEGDALEEFPHVKTSQEGEKELGSITRKTRRLFALKWAVDLLPREPLIRDVDKLCSRRNALVHYRPSKSGGDSLLKKAKKTPTQTDGQFTLNIKWDLDAVAKKIPPIMEELSGAPAVESYNTIIRLIRRWCEEAKYTPEQCAQFVEL